MQSPRILKSRITSTILLAVFILLIQTSATPNTVQDKEKKKVFTDEDLKVEKLKGKWRVQCMYDAKQVYDPSVPVIVKGINMFWGTDKYLGRVKVPEVMLENRSYRPTQTIQLKWTIVSVGDPDVALLKGGTPFFEAQVNPESTSRVDIPEVYFNKILKPLLKDGELNGHFRLIVGVQEVRFSDGQVWRAVGSVSLLRTSRRNESSRLKIQYLTPLHHFDLPIHKGAMRQPLKTDPCKGQPGLTTSAFLYASLQITDPPCRENRVCDVDPNTLLSICAPAANAYCDQGGCDSQGHCNCFMGPGRCTTCPDNDGDGQTSDTCGGADCDGWGIV